MVSSAGRGGVVTGRLYHYNGSTRSFAIRSMLATVKQFFEQYIAPQGERDEPLSERSVQLATAVLLIDMMHMDDQVAEEEREVIRDILGNRFSLSAQQTEELMALAEEAAAEQADYYRFTSLINKHFTPSQRERVVEYLWQVAYSDGRLDKYEEYLVRKLAELLHVRHAVFIAAKHRAVK